MNRPKRTSRGKRMRALLEEEEEADKLFWSQSYFQDEDERHDEEFVLNDEDGEDSTSSEHSSSDDEANVDDSNEGGGGGGGKRRRVADDEEEEEEEERRVRLEERREKQRRKSSKNVYVDLRKKKLNEEKKKVAQKAIAMNKKRARNDDDDDDEEEETTGVDDDDNESDHSNDSTINIDQETLVRMRKVKASFDRDFGDASKWRLDKLQAYAKSHNIAPPRGAKGNEAKGKIRDRVRNYMKEKFEAEVRAAGLVPAVLERLLSADANSRAALRRAGGNFASRRSSRNQTGNVDSNNDNNNNNSNNNSNSNSEKKKMATHKRLKLDNDSATNDSNAEKPALRKSTVQLSNQVSRRLEHEEKRKEKRGRPRRTVVVQLTQAQKLAEAKLTEADNLHSLERLLTLEDEKKERYRRKDDELKLEECVRVISKTIVVEGVAAVSSSTSAGGAKKRQQSFVIFPSDKIPDYLRQEPHPLHMLQDSTSMSSERVQVLCPITGLPARYKDPITNTPYANIQAYSTLKQRHQLLKRKEVQHRLDQLKTLLANAYERRRLNQSRIAELTPLIDSCKVKLSEVVLVKNELSSMATREELQADQRLQEERRQKQLHREQQTQHFKQQRLDFLKQVQLQQHEEVAEEVIEEGKEQQQQQQQQQHYHNHPHHQQQQVLPSYHQQLPLQAYTLHNSYYQQPHTYPYYAPPTPQVVVDHHQRQQLLYQQHQQQMYEQQLLHQGIRQQQQVQATLFKSNPSSAFRKVT